MAVRNKAAHLRGSTMNDRPLRACRYAGMLVASVLAGVLAVGCGVQDHHASGASQASSHSSSPRPEWSIPVVSKTQRPQWVNFSVLRGAPEGLPGSMRQRMRHPTFGMSWRLAQRLPFPNYGSFWLVPANGFLCLLGQRPGVVNQVCGRTRQVLVHGLFIAFLGAGAEKLVYGTRRFIIGVVPDRIREVLIVTDGSRVGASVIDNAFVQRNNLSDPPSRLILTKAGS
jgi:hypothetical protein